MKHTSWKAWRETWQHKDHWTRFAISWEFTAVAILRSELSS